MKVLVVNVAAPFVRGGAEYLADSLVGRVRKRGHACDLVRIPFKWYPPQAVLDHMLACRLLRVATNEPDLVIALKFPAYLAPAPNKKVWLLHQFRQVYELWGTPLSGMPDTPETRGVRDVIRHADTLYLSQARRLFTNSKIVAGRLKRYNDLDVDEVLYPPLEFPELYRPEPSEGYFFYPSRLNPAKRQHLAIEALRHTRTPLRLVLAGKPDSEDYGRQLRRLVEEAGLQDRVTFLGWVSEEEKARWMNRALGAVYLPFDEDSYGYVTLEAFHAHKPVLTCTDCGGVDELVQDGVNGLVVPPSPEALAEAMERLAGNPAAARDLGAEGFATIARHHIDWEYVLDRLLEPLEAA
jgi:glycosyltransferase involved in cell wall biosynthesis